MSRCLIPLSDRSRMTSDGGRSIWTYALMMKERADRAGIPPDTCPREAIASRHVRDLRLRERNYYPRSTNGTSSCRALGLPPFYFLFLCSIRQAWIRDAWSATRCPSRKNPWRMADELWPRGLSLRLSARQRGDSVKCTLPSISCIRHVSVRGGMHALYLRTARGEWRHDHPIRWRRNREPVFPKFNYTRKKRDHFLTTRENNKRKNRVSSDVQTWKLTRRNKKKEQLKEHAEDVRVFNILSIARLISLKWVRTWIADHASGNGYGNGTCLSTLRFAINLAQFIMKCSMFAF